MKAIVLMLLSLCVGLAVAPPQDKGWRGIIPLHSTRADVERLLGETNPQGGSYDLEDVRVSIIYQRHTCEENKGEGFNVPRDTVLRITLGLKNKDRSLSDFPLDVTRYKKTEGGHVRGYAYYTNEEQGITYETYFDKVVTVTYGGTAADAHLRCSDTLKPSALFSAKPVTYEYGRFN